jgi:hypothetical protein
MGQRALLIGSIQSRVQALNDALAKVGWQVTVVLDPRKAIEALKTHTFQVVFCDEQLRGATPAGLLVWVRRLTPEMPVYLFGETQETARFKLSGEPTGTLHFPPVLGQIPLPAGTNHEVLLGSEKTPLAGNTSVTAIADIIEMMGFTKQNGIVELEYGKKGTIHVREGKLEHALYLGGERPISGLQALGQLLQLEDVPFRVVSYKLPSHTTVNLPISTALTEAARLVDEAQRFQLLLNALKKACPAIAVAAIGYPVASSANIGFGDYQKLFSHAKKLLEANQSLTNAKLSDVLVCSLQSVIGIKTFGDGNILVAAAPAQAQGLLYKALHEAVALEPV